MFADAQHHADRGDIVFRDPATQLEHIGRQGTDKVLMARSDDGGDVCAGGDDTAETVEDQMAKTRVVVLGAGFGGLELTTILADALGRVVAMAVMGTVSRLMRTV